MRGGRGGALPDLVFQVVGLWWIRCRMIVSDDWMPPIWGGCLLVWGRSISCTPAHGYAGLCVFFGVSCGWGCSSFSMAVAQGCGAVSVRRGGREGPPESGAVPRRRNPNPYRHPCHCYPLSKRGPPLGGWNPPETMHEPLRVLPIHPRRGRGLDVDPTLSHHQLDLPVRERKPVVEPHAVGDDLGWKPESLVYRHPIDHPRSGDLNNLTGNRAGFPAAPMLATSPVGESIVESNRWLRTRRE